MDQVIYNTGQQGVMIRCAVIVAQIYNDKNKKCVEIREKSVAKSKTM